MHGIRGLYKLIVSERILTELTRTLSTPCFQNRITDDQAVRFVTLLERRAILDRRDRRSLRPLPPTKMVT